MANENKSEIIGSCALVKIEWNGGATNHYYCVALGYVNYASQNWIDGDETQGQILTIGDLSEKAGEVPNRDMSMVQTATIQGFIEAGTWINSRVTIIEGNRDPVTNTFTAFNTSYWRMFDIPSDNGLGEEISFTLSSEALGDVLNKADAWTYSANSQAQLLGAGITDTGFRFISNTSGSNGTAGSPEVIRGYNPKIGSLI